MKTRPVCFRLVCLAILGFSLTHGPALMAQASAPKKPAELYLYHCKGCHGATGKGDTKLGQKLGIPDFSSAKIQDKLLNDQMFKVIKNGIKKDSVERMKPYGDKFDEDQIKGLVAYVRSLKSP
jgi:mono/diheme cytochrome c family protein